MTEPSRSDEQSGLCTYLVYALAPEGMGRKEADDRFNDYLRNSRLGLVVHHDHFMDRPGAFAAIEAKTPEQVAALREPGPLEGWQLHAHPLQFSPTGAGFWIQADSTMRRFSGVHIEQGPPTPETLAHDYQILPGGRIPSSDRFRMTSAPML